MILIIASCKEKFHYYEFVKPIERLLIDLKLDYTIKPIDKISDKDFHNFEKIIITGTSLKDNFYINHPEKFAEMPNCDAPILGICAGMQMIGISYWLKQENNRKADLRHVLRSKTEIGFSKEFFSKEFLGLRGNNEVYHLHNNFIDFTRLEDFDIISKNEGIAQAVKHKSKQVYGVLFHPEVRQKELILNFLKLT